MKRFLGFVPVVWLWIAAMALFTFQSCKKTSPDTSPDIKPKLRILVPLYSYPTDDNGQIWKSAAAAADKIPLSVIWGMIGDTGQTEIEFYRQWLDTLRKGRRMELLAYVATTDGNRPIDSVKALIDYYVMHFDIDGIFLDEVNGSPSRYAHYRAIVQYVKRFQALKKVILNAPYASSELVDSTGADAVLFYENEWEYWDVFDWEDYQALDRENKAALVSDVFSEENMKRVLDEALARDFGYIYVTDTTYDYLPSYWNEEVNYVKQINENP